MSAALDCNRPHWNVRNRSRYDTVVVRDADRRHQCENEMNSNNRSRGSIASSQASAPRLESRRGG